MLRILNKACGLLNSHVIPLSVFTSMTETLIFYIVDLNEQKEVKPISGRILGTNISIKGLK